MNRREVLTLVSTIIGGSVIGGSALLEGCNPSDKIALAFPLTPKAIAFLDEIAETIIPTTDSPGAKAAQVGAFISKYVTDCYDEIDQLTIIKGINAIEEESKTKYKRGFEALNPEEKKTLLTSIDAESKIFKAEESSKSANGVIAEKTASKRHYFKMIKQLTIAGYFTSEIGSTKALRHVAVPGRFEGCVDYKKGEHLWSE